MGSSPEYLLRNSSPNRWHCLYPTAIAVAWIALAVASVVPDLAEARGAHGRGHHARHGGGVARSGFAGDPQHANDSHLKQSSEELDRVLDTKMKSICRGC